MPNVGQDDQEPEKDGDRTTAEDVGEWNDQDVCKSESDNVHACEERELLLIEVELCSKEWKHGRNGERGADQHPYVEQLRESRGEFPDQRPVQWVYSQR